MDVNDIKGVLGCSRMNLVEIFKKSLCNLRVLNNLFQLVGVFGRLDQLQIRLTGPS